MKMNSMSKIHKKDKKGREKDVCYWTTRKTNQITLSDLIRISKNNSIDDDAPIIFKNIIGYSDEDYYLTWEMTSNDDTNQITITLQPSTWYYGKKAKVEEELFQEEYIEYREMMNNETE